MAAGAEEKEEKAGDGVITAVYKLNLHCPQCARQIKKPLSRTEGIRKVDVDIEKNEIKVHGKIDVKEIQERIKKITKKKVELISPLPKSKDESPSEKKEEKKETKEPVVKIIELKVHIHCEKCEYDLKKEILKLEGVYSVKTDMKTQTLVAEGTLEALELVEYIRKKLHKHAEIVSEKAKEVEKKKEDVKSEETKKTEDVKSEETKKTDVKSEETKKKEDVESQETKKKTEEEEQKKPEAKTEEANVPYIVHYVYAPQFFSDENPNACSIM